jgi:hypothetical protein
MRSLSNSHALALIFRTSIRLQWRRREKMAQSAFAKDPKSLVRKAALALFRFLLGNDGVPLRCRPEAR